MSEGIANGATSPATTEIGGYGLAPEGSALAQFSGRLRVEYLRQIIKVSQTIVPEVSTTVTRRGEVRAQFLDPSHVAMGGFELTREAWEDFAWSGGADSGLLAFDLTKLEESIKQAKKGDLVDLRTRAGGAKLTVTVGKQGRDLTTTDPQGISRPKVPRMMHRAVLEVDLAELVTGIRGAESVSDHAYLTFDRKERVEGAPVLWVKSEGENDRVKSGAGAREKAWYDATDGSAPEKAVAMYPLDFFSNMVKSLGKIPTVTVRLGNSKAGEVTQLSPQAKPETVTDDYPMRMDWESDDGRLKGYFILAPRVPEGEKTTDPDDATKGDLMGPCAEQDGTIIGIPTSETCPRCDHHVAHLTSRSGETEIIAQCSMCDASAGQYGPCWVPMEDRANAYPSEEEERSSWLGSRERAAWLEEERRKVREEVGIQARILLPDVQGVLSQLLRGEVHAFSPNVTDEMRATGRGLLTTAIKDLAQIVTGERDTVPSTETPAPVTPAPEPEPEIPSEPAPVAPEPALGEGSAVVQEDTTPQPVPEPEVSAPEPVAVAPVLTPEPEPADAPNVARWMQAYGANLARAALEDPDRYGWTTPEKIGDFVRQMRTSFLRGNFLLSDSSVKRTCQGFGIRHTKKAIAAFLAGSESVPSVAELPPAPPESCVTVFTPSDVPGGPVVVQDAPPAPVEPAPVVLREEKTVEVRGEVFTEVAELTISQAPVAPESAPAPAAPAPQEAPATPPAAPQEVAPAPVVAPQIAPAPSEAGPLTLRIPVGTREVRLVFEGSDSPARVGFSDTYDHVHRHADYHHHGGRSCGSRCREGGEAHTHRTPEAILAELQHPGGDGPLCSVRRCEFHAAPGSAECWKHLLPKNGGSLEEMNRALART